VVFWGVKRVWVEKNSEWKEQQSLKTGICQNCGETDHNLHAFIECPDIQHIWHEGSRILRQLLGAQFQLQINYSTSEIILAFPELRRALPKQLRQRVLLWHLAFIYAITFLREASVKGQEARVEEDGVRFNFQGWEKIVEAQIRRVLFDIFQDFETTNQFIPVWVEGNGVIHYTPGNLQFRK
jgi:hypothetical protein